MPETRKRAVTLSSPEPPHYLKPSSGELCPPSTLPTPALTSHAASLLSAVGKRVAAQPLPSHLPVVQPLASYQSKRIGRNQAHLASSARVEAPPLIPRFGLLRVLQLFELLLDGLEFRTGFSRTCTPTI